MMKRRLRQLLQERQLDQIAELAAGKRRVLNLLVSLTFDADPLVRWRAIEAAGAAAARVAEQDPDRVREHLRRLYWLVSEESGGICWHAPELMAEIVRRRPDLFGDYVPIIVSLLVEMAEEDLMHFRAGILWAIGRLGPVAQSEFPAVAAAVRDCLDHPEAQVRAVAAWCLAECGHADWLAASRELEDDPAELWWYDDGKLQRIRVGDLVAQAKSSGLHGHVGNGEALPKSL